jgi:hypothetical protein
MPLAQPQPKTPQQNNKSKNLKVRPDKTTKMKAPKPSTFVNHLFLYHLT